VSVALAVAEFVAEPVAERVVLAPEQVAAVVLAFEAVQVALAVAGLMLVVVMGRTQPPHCPELGLLRFHRLRVYCLLR